MDGYTTLRNILDSALKQAGEESGMLLGQELVISLQDSLKTTKTTYFGDLDDSCFVIGVDSREAYPGQFYLVFSLRDAIVLSSTLLGIPGPRIKEKQRLSIIESDDIDAFSEIGNMVNGSFNTVFQGSLTDKVHLKVLTPRKFVPEIDQVTEEEPLPEGEYLMFRSKLEMEGQELNHLDVLIPVGLGNLFDPPVEVPLVTEDASTGESVSAGDAIETSEADSAVSAGEGLEASETGEPTQVASGIDSIVILEDDDAERTKKSFAVSFTGYQVVSGDLDADIKELFSGRNVRLVMIGSVNADDRELAVCIKVNAMRQDAPPPIIMSAERWTRTAVLKALKYGARDVLIMPCDEIELTEKVRKFCCQAV